MSISYSSESLNDRLCEGQYGHFAEGGRTFVITDPKTPAPWVNVLANERYGVVVSQAGGGFSWFENCQLDRLTRWENDLIRDQQGRFIYLQDTESGAIWSTTYQPTLVEAEREEIRHSTGSTTYIRQVNGIETKQTVFVPLKDSCEVWLVTVTNLSARRRKLRSMAYAEWHLGGAGDFHREFQRLFIETRTVGSALLAWKHPGLLEGMRGQPEAGPIAFLSVKGIPATHILSDKQQVLGTPARIEAPEALASGAFAKGNGRWEDPCAALVSDLILEPGQTAVFAYTLGATESATDSLRLSEKYDVLACEQELNRVADYWERLCGETTLTTGEPAVDVMVNRWLKYQTVIGRMVARCAYYQQGGAYGFRDQLQDSLALLSINPERTKRQIGLHAEATYEDGGVRHWWHPNTKIFAESKHSDTCLWLSYGTLAYLDETNDLASLSQEYRYLSRETQDFASSGTWLDHCFRGIDRALELRSKRGLPLIQAGDWNDGLSHAGLDGKGESVWVGMFLYDILQRWSKILPALGESQRAEIFAREAEALRFAVNEYGWDGQWYLEGTCDDGRPLGSKESEAGQIFLNPQTWAVISGIAPKDRVEQAMRAVSERLVTPYGALLLAPAYSKVDPWVGYITRYAPGSRENGGVYSHASTWAIQAYSMLGDRRRAKDLFAGMLPSGKSNQGSYVAEPYVMPGNVDGPDSPNEGRAGWTWYTGSSAWMYRVALDWLCGVRATSEGLFVDSQASSFEKFELIRKFRGDSFRIRGDVGSEGSLSCETAEVLQGTTLRSTEKGVRHEVQLVRKSSEAMSH